MAVLLQEVEMERKNMNIVEYRQYLESLAVTEKIDPRTLVHILLTILDDLVDLREDVHHVTYRPN